MERTVNLERFKKTFIIRCLLLGAAGELRRNHQINAKQLTQTIAASS